MYWRLSESGSGFALARLSGDEIRKGESALSQVQAIWHTASQFELKLGHLVVTTNSTGARRFEYRPDLLLLHELIANGEVDAVCARGVDRIHRNDLVRAQLEDLFISSGTQLYLSQFGHLDWIRDLHYWRRKSNQAEEERDDIFSRTHGGMIATRLAEGRGRPGALPFGFYYNPECGEVVVDPEQWPFVVIVHRGYEELHEEGATGGLRRLEEKLEALGCPMSVGMIANMLRNPIYVTGEYTVSWNGRQVTANPIKIAAPIPLELFQRNQERLALNTGRHSVTPVGFLALNGVEVIHDRCQDLPVAKEDAAKLPRTCTSLVLRGRPTSSADGYVYSHYPRTPGSCRGMVIPQNVLEPTVMRALRQLAANRELQEQWRRAPRGDPAERPRILSPEARTQVESELRDLGLLIEHREARWSDPKHPDSQMTASEFSKIISPLHEKRERLKRRLRMDDVLDPTPPVTPLEKDMGAIARAAGLDDESTYGELLEKLEEVLTDEPPDDPDHLRRRAAVVKASLSSILIKDAPDGFTLELRGPLVPPGTKVVGPIGPIASDGGALKPTSSPRRPPSELSSTSWRDGQFQDDEEPLDHRMVTTTYWSTPAAQRPKPLRPKRIARRPRLDWTPLWVSTPISLPCPDASRPPEATPREPWSSSDQDVAKEAIRVSIRFTGRGCGFNETTYARVRRAHPELPTYAFVERARRNSWKSWPIFVGEAIGEEINDLPLTDLARDRRELLRLRSAARTGALRTVKWGSFHYTRQEWVDEFRPKLLRPRSRGPSGPPPPSRPPLRGRPKR
ncbi:MAG: hypothetical protein AB7U07_13205 [Thermoleophilia bacterium]